MKITAVRTLDDLGRIVLPADIRKLNNWTCMTALEVSRCEDGSVIITEAKHRCCVCGEEGELTPIKTKYICSSCALELK